MGISKSLLFGEDGCALFQTLENGMYSEFQGRLRPLTPDLAGALKWRLAATEHAPPRSRPYIIRKPVLIYDDACGLGEIADVLIADCVRHLARTRLREWVFRPRAGIFEFELPAVALGLFHVVRLEPGRSPPARCDNMDARGVVIRVSYDNPAGRALSSVLWRGAPNCSADVWAEYVRATLNSPDRPSRMCPSTTSRRPPMA